MSWVHGKSTQLVWRLNPSKVPLQQQMAGESADIDPSSALHVCLMLTVGMLRHDRQRERKQERHLMRIASTFEYKM